MLWYKDDYGENSIQYQKMFTAYELLVTVNGIKLNDIDAANLKAERSRL